MFIMFVSFSGVAETNSAGMPRISLRGSLPVETKGKPHGLSAVSPFGSMSGSGHAARVDCGAQDTSFYIQIDVPCVGAS